MDIKQRFPGGGGGGLRRFQSFPALFDPNPSGCVARSYHLILQFFSPSALNWGLYRFLLSIFCLILSTFNNSFFFIASLFSQCCLLVLLHYQWLCRQTVIRVVCVLTSDNSGDCLFPLYLSVNQRWLSLHHLFVGVLCPSSLPLVYILLQRSLFFSVCISFERCFWCVGVLFEFFGIVHARHTHFRILHNVFLCRRYVDEMGTAEEVYTKSTKINESVMFATSTAPLFCDRESTCWESIIEPLQTHRGVVQSLNYHVSFSGRHADTFFIKPIKEPLLPTLLHFTTQKTTFLKYSSAWGSRYMSHSPWVICLYST